MAIELVRSIQAGFYTILRDEECVASIMNLHNLPFRIESTQESTVNFNTQKDHLPVLNILTLIIWPIISK